TTVKNGIESDLLKDLLAKGIIFDFADKYYYQNVNSDFNKIKDDKILSEFKKYLLDSDYKYESDVEKKINEIVKDLNEKHTTDDLSKTLEKLNLEVKQIFDVEFAESTDEILSELKIELAHRYLGNDAEIKEALKYDKQFNAALNLFNDDATYSKLLSSEKPK
ncbi:MAG TPA: S41 family peptidase, partial [Ignavibacteriaceae bacterium]